MALVSTQPLTEMSTRLFPGGKGGRCVRLTPLPTSCAVVMKSGNLNFLEPSGRLQACDGTVLPFTLYMHVVSTVCNLGTLHGMAKWTRWRICISFSWFLKFLDAMRKVRDSKRLCSKDCPKFDPHLIASWLQLCFLLSSSVTLLLQRFGRVLAASVFLFHPQLCWRAFLTVRRLQRGCGHASVCTYLAASCCLLATAQCCTDMGFILYVRI
jgi:hypothetical protein